MHVSRLSHTWFIYNLNTKQCYSQITRTGWYTRTYIYSVTPQLNPFGFPCWFIPFPSCNQPPLFYLLGDPFFGDRGANVHPLSTLVSDQLFTPCFLTLSNPPRRHPWFMLHIYRDNITTSATQSDTPVTFNPLPIFPFNGSVTVNSYCFFQSNEIVTSYSKK